MPAIKLDRAGTFRCRLVEKGLSKTKAKTKDEKDPGGYPQLITKVVMTELYDEKGGEDGGAIWFPVEDWNMETVAYSLLYGFIKKKQAVDKTLTCEQVMKVFKWDGVSLAELVTKDDEGLEFQIRVEENDPEYADKNPFQVAWIDVYDADPARTLRKLDATEIKALDAQFSTAAAASAKSAAKAPKTHPARVPADNKSGPKKPAASKAPKKQTAADKKAAIKAKSDRIKQENARVAQEAKAKAAAPPVPEEETSVPSLPDTEGETCTKAEAWAGIFEGRDPTINDETVKELWDAAIEEVAGEGVKLANVTNEQWPKVKKIVLADCGKLE